MSLSLDTRLAKLEARRQMQDDDFTTLSTEQLRERIEAAEAELIAHYGGTIEGAIAALEQENDPAAAACVKALKERAEPMEATA